MAEVDDTLEALGLSDTIEVSAILGVASSGEVLRLGNTVAVASLIVTVGVAILVVVIVGNKGGSKMHSTTGESTSSILTATAIPATNGKTTIDGLELLK